MRLSTSFVSSVDAAGRVVLRRCVEPLALAAVRGRGVEIGTGVRLHGMPLIQQVKDSRIVIGHRVVLTSWSSFTALGVDHPVILRSLTAGALIEIGDDTGISGAAITARSLVHIGSGTLIGSGVIITDSDHHVVHHPNRRYVSDAPTRAGDGIVIGKNCFIGARSVLLKGAGVGDNTVIGAGSILASRIPNGKIAAGNPCRVIADLGVHNFRPTCDVADDDKLMRRYV